jgi:predicted nucleic acid-binding protein
MQHVVDASVVAKWFLPEAHKDKADRLLSAFLNDKLELTAPNLLVAEVGNLLWKRSIKLREITPAQADEIYGNFLALKLRLSHSQTVATAALRLAVEKNHPIYDMLYIALAQQTACKFVTADEKLVNKFNGIFDCICWLGDL